MIHGSTEVHIALQTALRQQQVITLHIPQLPPLRATVTAVTHTYADLGCKLHTKLDTQLGLVRISFPFRDEIFHFSSTATQISKNEVRIDTQTSGQRTGNIDNPAPPCRATIAQRLPLQRAHEILHTIRERIQPWAEHRTSLLQTPSAIPDSPKLLITRPLPDSIPDFHLPSEFIPDTPQHRWEVLAPVWYGGYSCGHIELVNCSHQHFAELMSLISVCSLSLAHELLRPETDLQSYTLMQHAGRSLNFAKTTPPTATTGIILPTPSGCCFTTVSST